jgi:hypothetical protein
VGYGVVHRVERGAGRGAIILRFFFFVDAFSPLGLEFFCFSFRSISESVDSYFLSMDCEGLDLYFWNYYYLSTYFFFRTVAADA